VLIDRRDPPQHWPHYLAGPMNGKICQKLRNRYFDTLKVIKFQKQIILLSILPRNERKSSILESLEQRLQD
jgi:hypothetical protein